MGRRTIGPRAMTNSERVAKHRATKRRTKRVTKKNHAQTCETANAIKNHIMDIMEQLEELRELSKSIGKKP